MIVDIRFAYAVSFIPPRCRKEETRYVWDVLPVKLREADANAFPVAARVLHASDDKSWLADDRERMARLTAELRWNGHRLYAPAMTGHNDDRAPMDTAEFQRRLTNVEGPNPLYEAQTHDRCSGPRRPGAVEGRILADDRRERVATLLEAANRLIVADGRVFEPSPEPVWMVKPEGERTCMEAALLTPQQALGHARWTWRGDEAERARAEVRRFIGPDREVWARGRIEVLLPEALTLKMDDIQLIAAARRFVENMKSELPEASRETLCAYADLRDTARLGALHVSDDLAVCVRTMLDLRAPRHHRYERCDLREAYERWRESLGAAALPEFSADQVRGLADLGKAPEAARRA